MRPAVPQGGPMSGTFLASRPRRLLAEITMSRIPRRYSHFVYGTIQSGLTCAIAAAIANFPFRGSGGFVLHWFQSWLLSWIIMLPVVLFAAPAIRRLALAMTNEE